MITRCSHVCLCNGDVMFGRVGLSYPSELSAKIQNMCLYLCAPPGYLGHGAWIFYIAITVSIANGKDMVLRV